MYFFSKFIFFMSFLLIIGCGNSNTNPNMEQIIEFDSTDILATIDKNEDFEIVLDDIDTFSGNQSLKIINNAGCITLPVILSLPVKENQVYELSFAMKRTGESDYLDGCFISEVSLTTVPWLMEKKTKGIPINLNHYLDIEINQTNKTLLKTSKLIDNADVWEQFILTFSAVSEAPVSISLKCGYEIYWIDALTITALNNSNSVER